MVNRIMINEGNNGDINVTDWGCFEPRLRRMRQMNRLPSRMGFKQYSIKTDFISHKVIFLSVA